jgi:phosphopantothenoylcysteine decarboxylase/phosphopantothenate--cysteine ligase
VTTITRRASKERMATRRFLVTAGNTREMIDRVRDWGNVFTGNTGFAIAQALAAHGEVDLLTSNRNHIAQASAEAGGRIRASGFTSHGELKGALATLLARGRYDAIFMTAAVADYRPAGVFQVVERTADGSDTETWRVRNVGAPKVKSNHARIAILGEQTEKIVDLFRREWGHEGLLFKFKLEVGIGREELLQIGRASRVASGANYLVANTLDMVDGEGAGAYVISDAGEEFVSRAALARRLAELVWVE